MVFQGVLEGVDEGALGGLQQCLRRGFSELLGMVWDSEVSGARPGNRSAVSDAMLWDLRTEVVAHQNVAAKGRATREDKVRCQSVHTEESTESMKTYENIRVNEADRLHERISFLEVGIQLAF